MQRPKRKDRPVSGELCVLVDAEFGSDKYIGYPLEIVIPELHVAIEHEAGNDYQKKIQDVKRHLCKANGIEYVLKDSSSTDIEAVDAVRKVFRAMNIFITSDIQEDIAIARNGFEKLRNRRKEN